MTDTQHDLVILAFAFLFAIMPMVAVLALAVGSAPRRPPADVEGFTWRPRDRERGEVPIGLAIAVTVLVALLLIVGVPSTLRSLFGVWS